MFSFQTGYMQAADSRRWIVAALWVNSHHSYFKERASSSGETSEQIVSTRLRWQGTSWQRKEKREAAAGIRVWNFFPAYFEADHPSFGKHHLLPPHQPTLVLRL